MRFITYIFLLSVLSIELVAQSANESLSGKVSFVSPQNTYVRFKSTEGISTGDTLFIYSSGKLTPVLIVNNLSSASCVCTPITSRNLPISQDILARKKIREVKPDVKGTVKSVKEVPMQVTSVDTA